LNSKLVLLENETQTDSSISTKSAKAVFVIIVVKQIFNRAEHAQIESFAFERNVVSAGQVGSSVAIEAKNF
jgi:hypothetical protein